MVWYPTAEDVVKANKVVVRSDKHPHKLRRSINSIQVTIESIKKSEAKGLPLQAALFLQKLTMLHAFDGGNHRTAYSIANLFLIENGIMVQTVPATVSYAFSKDISNRSLKEVQAWILEYMVEN